MNERCPHCDEALSDAAGRCPRCGTPRRSSVVASGGSDTPPPRRIRGSIPPPPPRMRDGRPALEQPERGLAARFFGTVADVSLHPQSFFSHLSREGARGITWYAYSCVLLGTGLGALWALLLLPFWQRLLGQDAAPFAELSALFFASLVLSPVAAFFVVHLLAGLLHVSVAPFRSLGAAKVPYEATYRFVVYALSPMLFAALPLVGGIAEIFTLAVLGVAMAKLHRLRGPAVVGGVVLPVLLLSWLWNAEVLPRVAPPIAQAFGRAPAKVEAPSPPQDPDEAALAALPPTPPLHRDHSPEILEDGRWRFTERVFSSSRGDLFIAHRAAFGDEEGEVEVEVRVENRSGKDLERVFVELALPAGVEAPPEALAPALFTTLRRGESVSVRHRVRGATPKALLEVGPTVGFAP